MPLQKLMIDVPEDGYNLREAEAVLSARPSAGQSRQRLDQIGAPLTADVQLYLHPVEYQYWRVFWRAVTSFGALPFLMDLVIESWEVEECEVQIIPGTYATNRRGTVHLVQFQIEIKRPAPPSAEFDEAILALFASIHEGSHLASLIAQLEQFANFDLPEVV